MQLTIGEIDEAIEALKRLDAIDDVKLLPDVRMKIAINMKRLTPLVEAYHQARNAVVADLNKANRLLDKAVQRSVDELNRDLMLDNAKLRAATEVVKVKTFTRPDLRLDENPKIVGSILSGLYPLLRGFEIIDAADSDDTPAT